MKTVLAFFAGLAVVLGIAGAIVYFIYPGVILSALQSAAAGNAGLEKKQISINGYTAHYYEGGVANDATIVLMHGLGDDKNSFVTSVRELSQSYRVILPDLQGHGDNLLSAERDHSIAGQAQFIDDLLASIYAQQFVIGGNSMGGHIAAAYTTQYPRKVTGLVLVNAVGIQLDNESVYSPYPERVDTDYFKQLFERIFVTPPQFPEPVLQHLANELNPRIPLMNELIKQVETGQSFRLNESLASITAPTLIVWGKQDPIVGLEYADAFAEAIPNSSLIVIDDAGHSPQFEVPEQVQSNLISFLDRVYSD